VCRYVDLQLAERVAESRAGGPIVLERLVDEAMLRLHAEQREVEQLQALDARYVTIDPASINHTGIGAVDARADWADLAPFDDTLTAIATALGRLPEHQHDSLDVRRSLALGILADPTRAQTLLNDHPAGHPAADPAGDPAGDPEAKPTKKTKKTRKTRLVADLELTEANLLGIDPVITDADLRAHLDQVIRTWAARPDIQVVINPIRSYNNTPDQTSQTDCTGHDNQGDDGDTIQWRYTPTLADRRTVQRRTRTCVHPHCNRPARECDCDHTVPYADGGPTCPCNLAPLCRHHHRLKTHAGWHYWPLGPPGLYLWRDPHGLLYLRTRDGTLTLE
jgi:hypothetical protein